MRNELKDCDIEFVAPKVVAATGTAGTMLSEKNKPGITAWGRLTSRVIGTAEMQTH
jgi:hypothetical protein